MFTLWVRAVRVGDSNRISFDQVHSGDNARERVPVSMRDPCDSAMHEDIVFFAHGKETGPEATKVQYLAEIAKARGYQVARPDYSDLADPDERVRRLLTLAPRAPSGSLIFVGSSMGAYVSLVASEQLRPKGLYLLAPAISLEGYAIQDPTPHADVAVAVHGWNDEVVPVENVLRFAQRHALELHLLNADHRLLSVMPLLGGLFELFLNNFQQ